MSAYRQAAELPVEVRSCTLSGKVDRPGLYLSLVCLVITVVLLATRGDPIACVRDDGRGRCETAAGTFALSEIIGLELDKQQSKTSSVDSQGGENVTVSQLVLVTKNGRHPLESGWTYMVGDSRPDLVEAFGMFLRSEQKEFPRAGYHRVRDLSTALSLALAASLLAWILRKRDRVRIEADVGKQVLRIIREKNSAGLASHVTLPLSPPPTVTITDDSWLVLEHHGVTTPIVEVSGSLTERGLATRRLDTVVRGEPVEAGLA
jgi:hypothetical protein